MICFRLSYIFGDRIYSFRHTYTKIKKATKIYIYVSFTFPVNLLSPHLSCINACMSIVYILIIITKAYVPHILSHIMGVNKNIHKHGITILNTLSRCHTGIIRPNSSNLVCSFNNPYF